MCSINLLLSLILTGVKHCLRIAATFLYYKFRIYILYKCSYFCRCFSDSVGYSLGKFVVTVVWHGFHLFPIACLTSFDCLCSKRKTA